MSAKERAGVRTLTALADDGLTDDGVVDGGVAAPTFLGKFSFLTELVLLRAAPADQDRQFHKKQKR